MTKICINLKSKFISNSLTKYLNKIFGNICIDGYSPTCDYLITEDNMDTYNLEPNNLVILTQGGYTEKRDGASLIYYPLHIKQLLNIVYMLINYKQHILQIKNIKLIFSNALKKLINEDNGKIIELTNKECLLLRALFLAYPKPINKATLLQQVWYIENVNIETFTLESHISLLRKKVSNTIPSILIVKEEEGYRVEI